MEDSIKTLVDGAKSQMDKSIVHFEGELSKIRAGKASVAILDAVRVDYYGMPVPLSQAGSVTVTDARTLTIMPFERKMIATIERAIIEANIGLNPSNNGEVIRVPIPALNEARRKELVKQAKNEAEAAKVAVRNIRQDTNGRLKKLTGVSEDAVKDAEKKVQTLTDEHINQIDKLFKAKEDDILQV